ncbi:MAG: hypothetical protein Q4F79_08345 [Eubacteriales bacterium]|nr:hypothetical protein [Eubacteriales bacterium]
MNNCPACSRILAMKDVLLDGVTTASGKTNACLAAAYAAVVAWLSSLVISEAVLVKTCLISLGVLIGATFSDFFKKHRWLVAFVALASLALFVYKVIADMEEDDTF